MENVVSAPSAAFWHGRQVLVTGATGFKGAWLAIWLHRLGAVVDGLGLEAIRHGVFDSGGHAVLNNRILDIRDKVELGGFVAEIKPEIVFHLAAQPLVRASYHSPVDTFATNVMGTVHLLEACRTVPSVKAIVAITTDKVYANMEHALPYRETDRLGGHDPYSASKAACELVVDSYRSSFLADADIRVATARAGNVIGGGDWSHDRLLPDAVRAWSRGRTLNIRRPDAVRPWQHVLEPLAGYLILAERLTEQPELVGAYNMGPLTHEAADVRTIIDLARLSYGRGDVEFGVPDGPHEAGLLTLEVAKARALLGVRPRWTLVQAVERTMNWYRRQQEGVDARSLCDEDIDAWEAAS